MLNWKKLDEFSAYKGYRSIIKKIFQMPNGQILDYDIIDTFSFVCIAAATPQHDIILVEQYRPGPERLMVSFPEGQIDKEESPIETAQRELLEETGYLAASLEFVKEMPEAYSQGKKLIFIALNCEKIQEQRPDDSEFIRVFTMPKAEFEQYLINPQITNFNNVDAGYLLLNYLK
jgi:ADP-ribose pyrophosphatase